MQLVVATSPSPGCGQRIDDVEMRRYFRGSSSSSSGVSRPSLSAPLIAQWFHLWLLFHSAASSSGSLAMLAAMRRASSRVNNLAAAPARLILEVDGGWQANDPDAGCSTICKVPGICGNCPCLPRLILPCEGMLGAIASTLLLHRHSHHMPPAVVRNKRPAAADSSRAAVYSRWRRR